MSNLSEAFSMEGQEFRRSLLRDKVILFIAAGSMGASKKAIFRKAKELGVKSVVIDGPDSWAHKMVEDGTIMEFHPVTFSHSDDETLERMVEVAEKVGRDVGNIAGVCTFFEVAVPLATRLAKALGLPHNPPIAVDNARDKHATRRICAEAGLPSPKHASVQSEAELLVAAEKVGFPAVLKPVGLFQSMGVLRVNDLTELRQAFADVTKEIERTQAACADASDYRAVVANMDIKMVLEEFMDGDEQVVDLVFSRGECVYAAVTDNWPATRSFEPRFNETGSNSPSVLTGEQQAELIQLSADSAKALGFRLGVFCVNAKYTSRGARLIEVNSRMGGMFVRDHNKLCWGVDLVEEHLFATVDIPCRPPKAAKPLQFTGGVYASVEATGTIGNLDVLKEYAPEKRPEMVYMTALVAEGDEALGPLDAVEFPTWICGYMCTAPTVEEAIRRAQEINDDVVARVPILPRPDAKVQERASPAELEAAKAGKKDKETCAEEPTMDSLGEADAVETSSTSSDGSGCQCSE